MHKAVYFHKTTFALEEACRQLLRRCRDARVYGIPVDGKDVEAIVTTKELFGFNDNYVDVIVRKAIDSEDDVIRSLAKAILYRIPPKLIREEVSLVDESNTENVKHNACSNFLARCEDRLIGLAKKHDIQLGRFLLAGPKPIRLEKRGSHMTAAEARQQPPEDEDELIKVFVKGKDEPVSIVEIETSIIGKLSNLSYRIIRLYVLEESADKVDTLRSEVQAWD